MVSHLRVRVGAVQTLIPFAPIKQQTLTFRNNLSCGRLISEAFSPGPKERRISPLWKRECKAVNQEDAPVLPVVSMLHVLPSSLTPFLRVLGSRLSHQRKGVTTHCMPAPGQAVIGL